MSTFAKLLKKKRKESGLGQRSLAEKVGIHFTYLSKLENAVLPAPSADTILRLADALKCPPDELLFAGKKFPITIKNALLAKPEAMHFFQKVSEFSLSTQEWNELLKTLDKIIARHGIRRPSSPASP